MNHTSPNRCCCPPRPRLASNCSARTRTCPAGTASRRSPRSSVASHSTTSRLRAGSKGRVGVIEREMSVGVEAVWSVLADAASYPRWLSHLTEIRRIDGDWPAPGTAFRSNLGARTDRRDELDLRTGRARRDRVGVLECLRSKKTRSRAALESCGDDRVDCDGDRSRRGRVRRLAVRHGGGTDGH